MYRSKVVVPKNLYSNVCSSAFLFLPLPVKRELVSYLPPDCVQTKPWNPEDAWINKWTHRNIYMHLETYLKDPLATLLQHECSFFPAHFLTPGFPRHSQTRRQFGWGGEDMVLGFELWLSQLLAQVILDWEGQRAAPQVKVAMAPLTSSSPSPLLCSEYHIWGGH